MATSVYPQDRFSSMASADRRENPGASNWPYISKLAGDDHRQSCRRPLRCRMMLIEPEAAKADPATVIPAECVNVGNGGLYATVPLGYGVNLGQRYVFRLMIDERGPEPGAVQVVSQQGVVVRTELLRGMSGEEDRLGVGVRLAGNRVGVIPMPD